MQKKTAQELRRRHKLRRLVNPTGKALTVLNPSFRKVIRDLDKVDKRVRKEAEDLNYYIGMANSFVRRKDYLSAATYLTKFHEKIKLIHHQLNTFNGDISDGNRKFLLKQFKQKDKNKLFNYDPNKEIDQIKLVDDGLVSTAGIGKDLKDWWRKPGHYQDLKSLLSDKQTQSMRALERNFSDASFTKLKEDTREMLKISRELYRAILENFHRMGSAWGGRNVGAYIVEIQSINESYKDYHKSYVEYYTQNIVPMKELQEKINKENEAEAKAEAPGTGSGPVTGPQLPSATPKVPDLDLQQVEPFTGPPTPQPISAVRPVVPSAGPRSPESSAPLTLRNPGAQHLGPSSMSPETLDAPFSRGPVPSPGPNQNFQRTRNKYDTQRFPFFTQPNNGPKSEQPFSFNGPVNNSADLDDLVEYDLTRRKAHEGFIGRIEKLSDDHDIIREILSYSEEVEKYSEEESLKLLAVAEGLIEKDAAVKKKTVKEEPEVLAPPVMPEPSRPYTEDPFPPTEDLSSRGPITQKSGPGDQGGPATQKMPDSVVSPQKQDQSGDVFKQVYQDKFKPIEHGIPLGSVKKRWFDIPYLAKIRPEAIRVSGHTADLLFKTVLKKLDEFIMPYEDIEDFQMKFVKAIKKSIVQGQLESNMLCDQNRDCQLQIFSFIMLDSIDPSPAFIGQALTFTATCRLSRFEGHVTIGKITNVQIQNVAKQ